MVSKAQKRALQQFQKWGEYSPDMEHAVGCEGAAFNAVVAALHRKNLIENTENGGVNLTAAGLQVLAE